MPCCPNVSCRISELRTICLFERGFVLGEVHLFYFSDSPVVVRG